MPRKHKDAKFDPVEWHKTHQLRQRNLVKRTAGGGRKNSAANGDAAASSRSASDSENDTSEAAVSGSDSDSEDSDDQEEYGRNVGRGSDGVAASSRKKAGYVGKDGVLSARVLTHNARKRGDDPMRLIEEADAYEQVRVRGCGGHL